MTLYRQEIIERYRFPRYRGVIKNPHAQAEKINSLCGDEVVIFLRMDEAGKRAAGTRFDGQGCALMIASADILCEAIEGKTPEEMRRFTGEEFLSLYGEPPSPGRLKCVLLPYEALKSAVTLL